MKTLLLDNYDSYTYNLFQLLAEVNGESPLVIKNDQIQWTEVAALQFDNIVISPGPGTPENERDFGICRDALRFADVPVLGVCLGHQGLGVAFGASVRRAPQPMHGRRSEIFHDHSELFAGVPQGISVVRYHSLIVDRPAPRPLEEVAWTADGILMALRHRTRPLWGVQFHPESIATEYGYTLLKNFVDITRKCQLPRSRPCVAQSVPATVEPVRSTTGYRRSPLEVVVRRVRQRCDPEAAFSAIFADQPYAFWLDSSLVDPKLSRFSFMGEDRKSVV